MTNRLAGETSPYLLQHAENPVDWYPWGSEAFERAKREGKPVLLSVGYAACHWCHVMAHESFENEQVAALMNELFVNIKVDREERPDIDSIYMQAVQAMTGHGGWPMTVFMTPEGEPFFGGTYYPPTDRHGMPGFPRVLRTLADVYQSQPDAIRSTTSQLQQLFAAGAEVRGHSNAIDAALISRAATELIKTHDRVYGGFGSAPKFPPSMSLEFLLSLWARTENDELLDVVLKSFLAMSRGGIFDQLGGGLHRYSVDERWLVPHFEKMLYDNALFLRLGVHLWQATKNEEVREACTATVAWIEREMTSPEGGFYSALDADSEGHEGLFYLWSIDEIESIVGADAALATAVWGVTREGNFEGRNILYHDKSLEQAAQENGLSVDEAARKLQEARAALLAARSNRVWPLLDDKIIASWNGLMLRALAEYSRAFDDEPARRLALASGSFLASNMVRDNRIVRSWRNGKSLSVGFLEDQASVALAFLDLYSLTGERNWLDHSRNIAQATVDDFFDRASGLFFDTPRDHESLVTRPRDFSDNATPSGTSLIAELLLRLGILDSRDDYRELGLGVIGQNAQGMERFPQAFGHLLCAADMAASGAIEVVIAGHHHGALSRLAGVLHNTYLPSLVYLSVDAGGDDATVLGAGKVALSGNPVAYVCRGYVCDEPTGDPSRLAEQLVGARRAPKLRG